MGWMLSWFCVCVEAARFGAGGRCECLDVWFTVVSICLRDVDL